MVEAGSGQALQLSTRPRCRLAIGRYPAFVYDGRGGGGPGWGSGGAGPLRFPAETLTIPPLDCRSTRFLGLPLPPGLSITIEPDRLEGSWEPVSGDLELVFSARFRFRIGPVSKPLYSAPDLRIDARLSSGCAEGHRHRAQGRRLDPQGGARLVGIARVEPCGDAWLDRFLGLPDEALAMLECRITPRSTPAASPPPR